MKHHILRHVNKHHKKYLFASGLAFGRGIAKIMLIAGSIIGISVFANRSNTTDKLNAAEAQIKIYQALATFNQIEDMSHHYDEKIHELGYDKARTGNDAYHETEKAFHEAQNLNERYRIAKKLDDFVHQQHNFLQDKGYIDSGEDSKFHSIEVIFDQIQ